jgi:two-component sensor histidine kinase
MLNFLEGGGDCAEIIRLHDWSDTSLGDPAEWDVVLKTNVSTILGSRFPQCLFWGPDLIMIYNDGYAPLMGKKPCGIGLRVSDVWSDVWDGLHPIADKAMAGEPSFNENYELLTERNGFPEAAWFTFCYSPVRDANGLVVAVLNTVVETTETVLAKQRIELVNNELAHRMKNTFSVVNAIAAQTFGAGEETDSPQTRFANRLSALAAAQDVLLMGSMGRAEIGQIISGTLAPHLPNRAALKMEGPNWLLTGKQVFALALAVHELATNAAKYGAFSVPAGEVLVAWSGGTPGSDDLFELTWEERGVGLIERPKRTGFGTRLITRILPMEFGGTVELEYGSDGLRFAFTSTMRKLRA